MAKGKRFEWRMWFPKCWCYFSWKLYMLKVLDKVMHICFQRMLTSRIFWSLLLQHRQLLRMSCFLLFWPSNMYNIVYHALHHNILIGHQDRLNFWVQTLTQMSDSFISFLLLIYLWYLYIFQNNNFCILINVYRHISFSSNHSNIKS